MRTRALDALIRDFADNPNLISDQFTVDDVHVSLWRREGEICVYLSKPWTDGTDYGL